MHCAVRPVWDCITCGQPWPCAPAKVLLAEEYVDDRSALLVYLASCMLDALDDSFRHCGPEPARLYDRMLGWARVAAARRAQATSDTAARARCAA